MIVRVSSCKYH